MSDKILHLENRLTKLSADYETNKKLIAKVNRKLRKLKG